MVTNDASEVPPQAGILQLQKTEHRLPGLEEFIKL